MWNLMMLSELIFEVGTSPHLKNILIVIGHLESAITGIKNLPMLKEISLVVHAEVARLGVLQREVDTHPNHPILRLWKDWTCYDLDAVLQVQGSATAVQAEEATAGESSHPQAAGDDGEQQVS
jgi:disease resistance protein RPM1